MYKNQRASKGLKPTNLLLIQHQLCVHMNEWLIISQYYYMLTISIRTPCLAVKIIPRSSLLCPLQLVLLAGILLEYTIGLSVKLCYCVSTLPTAIYDASHSIQNFFKSQVVQDQVQHSRLCAVDFLQSSLILYIPMVKLFNKIHTGLN